MGSASDQAKLRALFTGGGVLLKQGGGAGANINTNIAIVGIEVGDTLVAAVNLNDGANVLDEMSITSDGNVQNTTTDTTGDVVLVTWLAANK